jgi:hypothetical protein
MRRLSRELISALRLSFEAWPDVAGQDWPLGSDVKAGVAICTKRRGRIFPQEDLSVLC